MTELPPVNEYGTCTGCGYKRGVGCTCGMSFKEKIQNVTVDREALRRFNRGGKGRRKGT